MVLVFGGFNYGEGESYIEVLVGVGDGRFFMKCLNIVMEFGIFYFYK